MKNKSDVVLHSIKTNKEIVAVLKKNKKITLPFITIWISNTAKHDEIEYALLVNKTQFKLAVVRNKIKRQLRNILIQSTTQGGFKILLKPNVMFLKKNFEEIKTLINNKIFR